MYLHGQLFLIVVKSGRSTRWKISGFCVNVFRLSRYILAGESMPSLHIKGTWTLRAELGREDSYFYYYYNYYYYYRSTSRLTADT